MQVRKLKWEKGLGLGCRGGGWLFKHFMPNVKVSAPRGIYLYGGVGTGKTMLMDMFYEQLYVFCTLLPAS